MTTRYLHLKKDLCTIMNTHLKKTVLVVSDGEEQFSVAASMFRDEGYQVVFKNDLRSSLETARNNAPKLIISELAVPDVDGLELCTRVRNDARLGATPVVLVGDLSVRSDIVADGFKCGAAGYVQKPFSQAQLVERCRALLGDETEFRQDTDADNLFYSMIEGISDAVTFVDAEDHTLLFASPSSKSVFGYEPGELLGSNLFDNIHPADTADVREYLKSIEWRDGRQQRVAYRVVQPDGSWSSVVSTAKYITDLRFGPAVIIITAADPGRHAAVDGVLDKADLSEPAAAAPFALKHKGDHYRLTELCSWNIDDRLICHN